MHGPEIEYVKEAYETNWMSTVGKNINEVERLASESSIIPLPQYSLSATQTVRMAGTVRMEPTTLLPCWKVPVTTGPPTAHY